MSPNDRRNAAAPVSEEHQGGAGKTHQPCQADELSVRRSRFSRPLDALLDAMYPQQVNHHSERWERDCANQLVRQGFSPEYIARRYGLTPKQVA